MKIHKHHLRKLIRNIILESEEHDQAEDEQEDKLLVEPDYSEGREAEEDLEEISTTSGISGNQGKLSSPFVLPFKNKK